MIDPRLRVVFLLAVSIGVFFLEELWQLAAVLVAMAALWLLVRLPLAQLARQLAKLWLFAIFVVISYALFDHDPGSDRWHALSLGGLVLPVNVSGAREGVEMVVRVLTVVLASQVARAGDPRAIAAGLAKLRVPSLVAVSLDVVLSLLGDGGGGGGGRGRGRGNSGESFWSGLGRLARGDVEPVARRIERQIARAEEHASASLGPGALARDVSIIAGITLTMLGIKMLKMLPALPFAPGHKLVVLTPLYILAAVLTRSRFGATLTGVVMGAVAFLMGDGRYGVFEILKHVTPGLVCDALIPWMMRGRAAGRLPSGFSWSLFGGIVALGRFATIFCVTLLVQPPAVAYAVLAPGLLVNVFFGVASGYVSYHLLRAALRVQGAPASGRATTSPAEQQAEDPPEDPAREAAQ